MLPKPGMRVGSFEILGLLGSGGMGEVYRALDTRLGREVALKVLPEAFARDPERLARFEREAKVLASLNHPNIAAIYGIEAGALVMELVEGPTLADRFAQGPVPLEETLEIARQIADALEASHEKGITHRDLKPANIKITPQGVVKVLDFGLAVAQASACESGSPENSPTLTLRQTETGMILGTAAYMAPEQARGKTVDKRADIWAFGVVLYEMLAGRRLFEGETVSDTLAAVLKTEPDWSRVPVRGQRLLRRCLEKDPKKRLRDIGDAMPLVEDVPAQAAPQPRARLPWLVAAVAAITAMVFGALYLRPAQTGAVGSSHLALTIVPGVSLRPAGGGAATPEISPDGSSVLYRGAELRLQLRRLSSLQVMPLPGTDGVNNPPFWSADSSSIAFPTLSGLKRMRMPDGAPVVITRLSVVALESSGTWGDQGAILLSDGSHLYAAPAAGVDAKPVDVPGLPEGDVVQPEFLPGGTDFLFGSVSPGSDQVAVYLATLREGKAANLALLLRNDTAARYTPASGGRILFVRNDNLYAQRLDLRKRKLEGDAELLVQGVASAPARYVAHFSVSRTGIVAWRPGRAGLSQVTVFDRRGRRIGTAGPPSPVVYLALSPDEKRLLAGSGNSAWLIEPDLPGRLGLGQGAWFLWSPEGNRLLGREGPRIVERPLESNDTHELAAPGLANLNAISPDGKVLLYQGEGQSVFSLRLDDSSQGRIPQPLLRTGETVNNPRFSPDGHWLVYQARTAENESLGIYVQPFPGPGLRKQIATSGRYPIWRGDSKEIVYYDQDRIWSVRLDSSSGELRAASPEPLFPVQTPPVLYALVNPLAISRDGSRIFFPQPVEQPADSQFIHVMTGWAK